MTEIYSRIPWELVADSLGPTEYNLGTTDIERRQSAASYISVRQYKLSP
jgi:hypothetical protein